MADAPDPREALYQTQSCQTELGGLGLGRFWSLSFSGDQKLVCPADGNNYARINLWNQNTKTDRLSEGSRSLERTLRESSKQLKS